MMKNVFGFKFGIRVLRFLWVSNENQEPRLSAWVYFVSLCDLSWWFWPCNIIIEGVDVLVLDLAWLVSHGCLLLMLWCRDPKGPYGLFWWARTSLSRDPCGLGLSPLDLWYCRDPSGSLGTSCDLVNLTRGWYCLMFTCCYFNVVVVVVVVFVSAEYCCWVETLLWSRQRVHDYFVKCWRLCGWMGTDCETVKLDWRR